MMTSIPTGTIQMVITEIKARYFTWLKKFIDDSDYELGGKGIHNKLLIKLFATDFYWTIPLDVNRMADGLEMRNRFFYETHLDPSEYSIYISGPCSIFEMMVALAVRCEEHIMGNPAVGDRTGRWFWYMIDSLGLSNETDISYNEQHIDHVLRTFLTNSYKSNGSGGLFRVPNTTRDLSKIEIWTQMNAYLNSLDEK